LLRLFCRLRPVDVDASRKRLEQLGEVWFCCCCWLLFLLLVEGNPTNSQSTLSEAGSRLRPPAWPLEKAYLERLRILVRRLFILRWAWLATLPPVVATSVSHMAVVPVLC
jgi:hypothetical protein